MPNTKSVGIAFSDPALEDGTWTGGTISGAVITGSTMSGGAVSGTSLDIAGGATIGGTSTAALAFYDAAATSQPTSADQAAAISTAPVSISATQWGFTSSAQALSVLTLLNQLRLDLIALGLIKGS